MRCGLSSLATAMFILLLAGWSALSFAATDPPSSDRNYVELQANPDYYENLLPHTEYMLARSTEITIDTVRDRPNGFTPVTTPYIDFGLTTDAVWLRFTAKNTTDTQGRWRLDLNRQYIKELHVYLARENSPPEKILSHQELDRFQARPIPSNMLAVDFTAAAQETVEFYIGYKSTATTYLPIGIGTPTGVTQFQNKRVLLDWVLNGALIFAVVFTLFMTPVIGWRLGLSFALYMMAGFFYVFNADGYTFQYLWPNRPEWNDPLNLSFMLLMSVFGLSFARALFNFKSLSRVFDLIVLCIIYISGIFAILALFFVKVSWFQILAYSWVPVGTLMQIGCAIMALKNKRLGSVPYAMGAFIVLTSIAYATIAHLRPGNFSLDRTLDYGHLALISECIAFATAIMLRLAGLRRERDAALISELKITREKLQLSADLQKSQADYIRTRKISDLRGKELSSVTHDIAQPLASLRLALNNIDGKNEAQIQQMHKAFDYIEDLARSRIVTDDPAMGRTDNLEPLETFPLNIVLDNVYEMFAEEARAKGLSFRYQPADHEVRSDPIRLMRAVSNLVSNAINYTDSGTVELTAQEENNRLVVRVTNTGAALSQDMIERILQPHEKGPQSKGSGLGLSIVQDIAKDLGLTFEFTSETDQGTTGTLTFP